MRARNLVCPPPSDRSCSLTGSHSLAAGFWDTLKDWGSALNPARLWRGNGHAAAAAEAERTPAPVTPTWGEPPSRVHPYYPTTPPAQMVTRRAKGQSRQRPTPPDAYPPKPYYSESEGSADFGYGYQLRELRETAPAPPNSELGSPIAASENGDFLPAGYPQTKEGELAFCEELRRVSSSPFRSRLEAQRAGDANYGRVYGLDGIRPADYGSDATEYGSSSGGRVLGSEYSAAGNSAFRPLPPAFPAVLTTRV